MFYRFGGIHFWLFLLPTVTNGLVMPRIRRMTITSDIRYRFCTTHISLDVGNTQSYTEDFYFETQLPVGSLISNVSLYVNGTHYKSKTQKVSEEYKIWLQKTNVKLKPIKEDRSLYFDSNIFVMMVPIAGLSKAQFNLTYNYLLHRQNNKYQFPVYLFFRQGQYVSDVVVNTYLWEPTKIVKPTVNLFKEHNMPEASVEQKIKSVPKIRRISPKNIHISYETSLGMIRNLFTRNLLLEYSLKQNPKSSGNVLWHNNEGLIFFSPRRLKPFPKDIIFTIDYTDSMKGKKLSEVKKALSSILQMTSSKDRFRILLYNKDVYQESYGLLPVNAKNIKMALGLFNKNMPSETSDLNLAIQESLNQLNKSASSKNRIRVVYFLTDGWQSMNNVKRHKITKSFRKANADCKAIFFTVALYPQPDYILLKTLSNLSGGKMMRITEKQNISKSMVNFYKEMKTPLLTNLSTVGPFHNTSYYVGLKDYYKGSENILYFNETNVNPKDGSTLYVYSDGANGAIKFKNTIEDSHIKDNIGGLNNLQRNNFMARYLDFIFIRMVIDRKLKTSKKEAIDRAMRHGFLTPWTYMSALPSSYNAVQDLVTGETVLDEEIEVPGRGFTGSGVGDPHFTVSIRGLKRPVCFDLSGHDGDVINLLADDTANLYVNGKIIKAGINSKKTYLGEIRIIKPNKTWVISPDQVERTISDRLQWKDIDKVDMANVANETYDGDQVNRIDNKSIDDILIKHSGYRTLTLTTSSEKGRIEILLRRSESKHQPVKTKYLNFYLTDSTGLSNSIYGLIGQFISWKGNITKLYMEPNGKIQSWIKLKNERKNQSRNFTAVLTHNRRSMFSHQQCWTVWKEGKDFIKGKYEDYLIHGLHSEPWS